MKKLLILVAAALLLSAVVPAHAHARARVFIGVGVPLWWGPVGYPYPYYSYPYYSYPPPVVIREQPPIYVQQPQPAPQAQPESYWYYCADAKAYYPYVRQCPGGWMKVVPQAPPPGQ
jgi:hypothetical protein